MNINLMDNGEDVIHYITDPMETAIFVPLSEFNDDDCVNGRWATILCLLKKSWEKIGDKNIYAFKRLEFDQDFVLANEPFKLPPLDIITRMPIKSNIGEKQLLIFRHVEVDELEPLLNNC